MCIRLYLEEFGSFYFGRLRSAVGVGVGRSLFVSNNGRGFWSSYLSFRSV